MQPDAVERSAEGKGRRHRAEHVETDTGKETDPLGRRPELGLAFDAVRHLRCPVIVAKPDRLSPDAAFLPALMVNRVPLLAARLGADADPFLLHFDAVLAEKERRFISERTRVILDPRERLGARLGNAGSVPIAASLGQTAQVAEADRFATKMTPLVESIRVGGATSLAGIAHALNTRRRSTGRPMARLDRPDTLRARRRFYWAGINSRGNVCAAIAASRP